MHTNSYQKLAVHLKAGRVYRREALNAFSKAVDRDLATLTDHGVLKKIAAGIYYKPASSRFGVLPPNLRRVNPMLFTGGCVLIFSGISIMRWA